jgi:hypothetical protein
MISPGAGMAAGLYKGTEQVIKSCFFELAHTFQENYMQMRTVRI